MSKRRNVYEFDLSKFYDRISHKSILDGLLRLGTPRSLLEWSMKTPLRGYKTNFTQLLLYVDDGIIAWDEEGENFHEEILNEIHMCLGAPVNSKVRVDQEGR